MKRRRRRVVCLVTFSVAMAVALVVTTVLLVRSSSEEVNLALEEPDVDFPPCVPHCSGSGCCNKTVEEVFNSYDFDAFFPNRNSALSFAKGFYDYYNFIQASLMFARKGFGLLGGEEMQKREIAAFLAHVAHESTCGYNNAPNGGAYAWGLCRREDESPSSVYCDETLLNPCVPGVSYHARGAMQIVWNYNYNWIGKGLDLDLLHYPNLLADNGTLAFASSLYKWMTPRNGLPSPHRVMTGQYKPTKNDTDGNRLPGFGLTINILSTTVASTECGHGDDKNMNDRIAHYHAFLHLLGDITPGDNLDCAVQAPWMPVSHAHKAFAVSLALPTLAAFLVISTLGSV